MKKEQIEGTSVDADFGAKVDSYWIGKDNDRAFACPNISLFRMIGGLLGSLRDKKVLEVGFAHGADLLEAKRRGADVSGLDLNPKYVDNVKRESACDVRQFRAGTDEIPFGKHFDLIFARDLIYYLTDEELLQFFSQCAMSLSNDGALIVQFIETDLKLKDETSCKSDNFDPNFLSNYEPHRIHPASNPIRFLASQDVIRAAAACDLSLTASKRMLQSYDLHEVEIRVDKYLAFSKAKKSV